MKSVKEVAGECGISRQAIYKKIYTTMQQELQPFTVKKDKVTYILPEGIELIKKSIDSTKIDKEDHSEEEQEHRTKDQNTDTSKDLEHVNRLINLLEKELEEKNKQLEKQGDLLRNFEVLFKEQQGRLDLLEDQIQREESPVFKPSGGFLSRLKLWKNTQGDMGGTSRQP